MDPFTIATLTGGSTSGNTLQDVAGDVLGNFNPLDIVGDLFSNGFNLSCINSTENLQPSFVKNNITSVIQPKLQPYLNVVASSQDAIQFGQALNKLSERAEAMRAYFIKRKNSKDWSACSKEGLNMYIAFCTQLRQQVEALASNSVFELLNVTTKSGNTRGQQTMQDVPSVTISTSAGPYTWKEWTFKSNTNNIVNDVIDYITDPITGNSIDPSTKPTQSLAGGGMVFGIILLLVWLSGGFKKLTQKAKNY